MKLCIVVPGICGSRLDVVGSRGQAELWVNRLLLAGGGLGWLSLAPDGVSPPAVNFPPIVPNGPLSPYYDNVQGVFRRQLADNGFDLVVAGVDWRQSVFRNAAVVAAIVQAQAARYESFALVGHSQGGLIVRRAWQGLSQVGQAGAIARLITLGTPHGGSWSPAAIFAGAEDLIPQLGLIAFKLIVPGSSVLLSVTLDSIRRVAATWPGLYELLPLSPVDPLTDPFIRQLYQATSWPAGWGIQQRWLDWTSSTFRDWLLDLSALPPFEVLTTVGGNSIATPTGWKAVDEIGNPALLRVDGVGDGTVLLASALLPASKQYTVSCPHQSMPEDMALSGQLIDLVTEVRSPAPPPYPVGALAAAGVVGLAGPPLALVGVRSVDP